jgi:hypothetical protein
MHLRMPAALALLASVCFSLTACGPDESATTSATPVSNAQQFTPANDPVNLQAAVTSGEQQQVTPVVHYPPDTSSAN